jgi:hypothetical protein
MTQSPCEEGRKYQVPLTWEFIPRVLSNGGDNKDYEVDKGR